MGDSPTIASKKASIDDEILPAASRRATLIDETIQAPASNNRNPKARTPPRLSPPALKRQRTEPAKRTSSPLAHGANLNRSFPTFAHHTDTSDNGTENRCSLSATAASRLKPQKQNATDIFSHPNRASGGLTNRQDDEISTSSGLARSEMSRASGPSARTCRLCRKPINKSFNPLILCTACARPYHDACRNPPLIVGANAKVWRCLKCASRPKTPSQVLPGAEGLQGSSTNETRDHSLLQNGTPSHRTSSARRSPTVAHTKLLTDPPNLDPEPPREYTVRHLELADLDNGHLLNSLQDDELDSMIVETMRPKPTPVVHSRRRRRSEIPDTPEQPPSQSQIELAAPQSSTLQADVSSSIPTQHEIVSRTGLELQRIIPNSTSLCHICKKQTVMVDSNCKVVRCLKCKNKRESLPLTQVTIPETPGPMSPRSTGTERGNRLHPTVPGLIEGASPSPTVWLQPLQPGSLYFNSKKIVARKLKPTEVSPTNKVSLQEPAVVEDPVPGPPTPTGTESPGLPEDQQVSEEHRNDSDAVESLGGSEQRLQSDAVADTSAGADHPDPTYDRTILMEDDVDQSEEGDAEEPSPLYTAKEQRPLPADSVESPASSVVGSPAQPRSKLTKGKYTNKQLAGVALLALGEPSSAGKVQQWVADNFSGYKRGTGGWDRSIQSSLSGLSEFRSLKGAGRLRLYDFANAASRRQFEKMFGNHPAVKATKRLITEVPDSEQAPEIAVSAQQEQSPIVPPLRQMEDVQPDEVEATTVGTGLEAGQNDDTQTAAVLPQIPQCNSPNGEHSSTADEAASHCIGGIFMPFEDANRYRPIDQPDPPNVRRESSFAKAFPELMKTSADTMSDSEIEDKIKEIKSRPSRKSVFGKRLAFVRPHRKDVHDELAGTHRARSPPGPRDSVNDDTRDGEEPQSLRDSLKFPQNPIPILHNNQLAFRDGTSVNGKLPRSRVVYKVGRKLGTDIRLD